MTPSASALAVQAREPTRTSRLLWLAAAAAVVAVIGVLAAITIGKWDDRVLPRVRQSRGHHD